MGKVVTMPTFLKTRNHMSAGDAPKDGLVVHVTLPDEQFKVIDKELKRLHDIISQKDADGDMKKWAVNRIEELQNQLLSLHGTLKNELSSAK